ncbi:hypothetical protein [Pseudothermotoga sp.]|uniref:RNA polymerase factor sigma-54 n=1 Tax=Pseudothermotoga sp. TaxID=2033661 RepID=UPI0031F6666E
MKTSTMRISLDLRREFSNRELFFKLIELPTRDLIEFLKNSFPYVSLDVEDEETGLTRLDRLANDERSLQEELMESIALLRLDEENERIVEYIVYNLDESGRLLVDKAEICQKFCVTEEVVEKLMESIKAVGPDGLFEGKVVGFGGRAAYIQPDLIIQADLSIQVKEFTVSLERSNKKAEKFLVYLNGLLQRRKEILIFLGNMIVRKNVDFLLGRVPYPSKIKIVDAAEDLQLHASTVCRAVSTKYVKTPVGTFPMRAFFGRNVEQQFFLPLLCKLLKENPDSTDEQLRKMLKNHGVEVSRRTVNKYRNLIGGFSA